jgi:hypothetical protein
MEARPDVWWWESWQRPSAGSAGSAAPQLSVPSVTVVPSATVPSVSTPPVSAPSGTAPVPNTASQVPALVGGARQSAQASGAPGDPASAAPDTTAATGLAGGGNVQPAGGSGSAAVWERLVWGHAVC